MPENCTPDASVIWAELRSLRELIVAVREGDQQALKLQSNEYSRRLDELNHAHAQATERNASYIPRETHERDIRRLEDSISILSRLIFIGVGIAIAGELLIYTLHTLGKW